MLGMEGLWQIAFSEIEFQKNEELQAMPVKAVKMHLCFDMPSMKVCEI